MYSSQQQQQQQQQQGPAATRLNVLLLGDSKVGKSSLAYSLAGQSYKKARSFSTKVFVSKSFTIPTALSLDNEYDVKTVVFWDMSGAEEYDKERRQFHVPVDVVLLCFSKDDPETFHSIRKRWKAEISEHMVEVCETSSIVLVMTKSDLHASNCVSTKDVLELAKELNAVSFIECSSLTTFSVKNLFQEAVIAGACYRASLPRVPPIGTPPKVNVATVVQKSVPVKSIAPLLVVVGDPACGKSSIVREFFGCDFEESYSSTEIPFTLLLTPLAKGLKPKTTLTQDQIQGKESVFVADMPPNSTKEMVRRLAYAHSNVLFLICVPIFSLKAAEASARKWVKIAREAVPSSRTLLVGTKLDMYDSAYNAGGAASGGAGEDDGAFFLLEDGKKLASELSMASYSECSALNLFGVPNLRDYCVGLALSGKTLSQSMRGAMSFASSFLNKFASEKSSSSSSSSSVPSPSRSPTLQQQQQQQQSGRGLSSSLAGGSDKRNSLDQQALVVKNFDVNIVLVGAPGVGKTSFVERYVRKRFKEEGEEEYARTVGVNCYQKLIEYDAETTINLQLWDFSGETPLIKVPADPASLVFLCVFDVTKPAETLEFVAKALARLDSLYGSDSMIPRELAANKIDLEWPQDARDIADGFARDHSFRHEWIRMSASTGQQIATTVSAMIKLAMNRMTNKVSLPSLLVPNFSQTVHRCDGYDEEEVIVMADDPYIVEEYTGPIKDDTFDASSCPYSKILE